MFMSPTAAQVWTGQYEDQLDLNTANVSTTLTSTPADLNTPEYLAQLLKDRRQLAAFPNTFFHVERLLDQEINNLRVNLFNLITRPKLDLPHPTGDKKIYQEKVYIPVKEYPDYNFVGRILGPRGLSAKQFEAETGCKIIVRGRGSFRDKQKEEENRGKPNYEHLNEDLHVILQCEDDETRALAKLKQAKDELNKLLTPPTDGEDHLKKKQLTELAILKGTYRDPNTFPKHFNPLPIGAPLILTPELLATSSTTATTTPLVTTTFPSNCLLQNPQSNFLQILTPLPTMDSMGNFLSNETQFVEYPNSIAFPFLTTTVSSTDSSSIDHSHSVRYQPYKTTRHNRS